MAMCQRAIQPGRLLTAILSRSIARRSVSSTYSISSITEQRIFHPTLTQKRFHQLRDYYERSPNAPRPGKKDYEERVFKALNTFDRYPKDKKLTLDTHFINDLGLDSLDHVELIVALEEEFNCEIPDEIAEKLMTPKLIWEYLCEKDKVPDERTEYHRFGTQPEDFKF